MTRQLPDGTDLAPATVSDLTDMIESRYSGQITPRDLDVAKLAFAAGAASERELVVRDVQEHFREIVTAHAAKGNDILLGVLLDAIRELCVADLLDGAQ